MIEHTNKDGSAGGNPAVVVGTWFRDHWISPFAKFRFEHLDQAATHIMAEMFRPPVETQADVCQQVVFRNGADFLASHEFNKLGGEFIRQRVMLPKDRSAGPFDISLRCSRRLKPTHDDRRDLGVVLLSLEARKDG